MPSNWQIGSFGTLTNMTATKPTASLCQVAAEERSVIASREVAPLIPRHAKRVIRRTELRQIVPLADTTIYEMEQRGNFPRRFYLTSRCVVSRGPRKWTHQRPVRWAL
jgi:predicted DNA-binding transcriptional regulator AlpA